MKRQFNISKAFFFGIILSSISLIAMEKQATSTFKGIINNTDKDIVLFLGTILNPLETINIKPNTALLKDVELQGENYKFSVCHNISHCLLPRRPKYSKFIVLVDPLIDPVGRLVKGEEIDTQIEVV